MPDLDATSYNSQGLLPSSINQVTSTITSGMPVITAPPTTVNVNAPFLTTNISTTDNDTNNLIPTIPTNTINPTLYVPQNDPCTLIGQIVPYLNPTNVLTTKVTNEGMTFSGSDIHALLEVPSQNSTSIAPRIYKELIELTTLSVSIHRAKSPARALGYIGAKGYARGSRTIAGTMVFTKFTCDVLINFLQDCLVADLSKDSQYRHIDQLPPFNLTLLFANEFGFISYQSLLGIDFITDGSVYSVQDTYSESQLSYVASDFTPLLPYTQNALTTLPTSPASTAENTVQSIWQKANIPNG